MWVVIRDIHYQSQIGGLMQRCQPEPVFRQPTAKDGFQVLAKEAILFDNYTLNYYRPTTNSQSTADG